MNKKTATIAISICLVMGITAGIALAQRRGQAGQRGGFGGAGGVQQGRGQMQPGGAGMRQGGMSTRDPQQMRTMMMQRLRTQLRATDQQWTTLGPRLEKVMELNRQVSGRGGMFGGARPGAMGGGFGGPGGRQGPRAAQPGAAAPSQTGAAPEMTDVDKATQELQQLLRGNTPNAEEIKTKLTALRQAKTRAKQDLAKAQTELKQGLSINQEATLVLMGYLD